MHGMPVVTTLLAWIVPAAAALLALHQAAMAVEPPITHGPILGRLAAHEVGVWIRTARAGRFEVRYSRRGQQGSAVVEGTTRLDADNTGWVLLDGLESDTRYDYWVYPAGAAAPAEASGTFRTLPDAEQVRDAERNPRGLFNFSFEFGCGNFQGRSGRQGRQPVPVFATILREHGGQLNFAIQNGDWTYEAFRDYSPDEWRRQVGIAPEQTPRVVRVMPPLAGAWENIKAYLDRSRELAAWHANMPVFFTFDDHEIVDDAAGAGTIGARPRRALFRDIGLRAWYDYAGWANPLPFSQDIQFGRARFEAGSNVLTDAEADFTRLDLDQAAELHVHWGGLDSGERDKALDTVGGDPNAGVYRVGRVLDRHRLEIDPAARADGTAGYSIGRLSYFSRRVANCELLFLDTRSHRDLPDNDNPKKPGVSLLGRRQKQWLEETLAGSDADCFFLVSSVNFMVPHHVDVGQPEYVGYDDSWTSFWLEREELIGLFERLDKPVFLLTGDLHNSFVVKVTDKVWEFASAPHNSSNATMFSEGRRPPNGWFDSHGRKCFIRWSTWFDNSYTRRAHPQKVYCVVSVNNVFWNPLDRDHPRWQAYPHPQVVFQYYDGLSGKLLYAESVVID